MSYEEECADAESLLRFHTDSLALAEREFAQEVLLNVLGGKSTWDAQQMAEVSHGRARHVARAEYEIALARLRRA